MRTNPIQRNTGVVLIFLGLFPAVAETLVQASEPASMVAVNLESAASPAICLSPTRQEVGETSCFFAGTELSMVQVEADTGGVIRLSHDSSGTPGTDLSILDGDGYTGFTYAPRFWIGRKFGPRWGVVGRFWNMSANESGEPNLTPGTVELTNFSTQFQTSRTNASAVDLEAIRTFTPGACTLDFTVGARQASYNAESEILSFGVFTSGNFVNLYLANSCGFDGAGATYSAFGKRQISDRRCHIYFGARGSNLYGESDSMGRSSGSVASSPSSPLVGAATVRRQGSPAEMHIGEAQLGIQWDFPIKQSSANVFFRTGAEYQYWNFAGNPTGGAGFGGTIGTLTTNSFASAGLGDLELYGWNFGTGFTW